MHHFWLILSAAKFCFSLLSNTLRIAFAFQIDFHAPISIDSIMSVINLMDLCLYFCFFGIVIRLPVFPVVIVCVWTDLKPALCKECRRFFRRGFLFWPFPAPYAVEDFLLYLFFILCDFCPILRKAHFFQ